MKQLVIIILSILSLTNITPILSMDYTKILPAEIKNEIFALLTEDTQREIKQVCKNWRAIITNTPAYKTRIKMGKLLLQGNQRSKAERPSRTSEIVSQPGGRMALSPRNFALTLHTTSRLPLSLRIDTDAITQRSEPTRSYMCTFQPITEEDEVATSSTRSLTPNMSEISDRPEISDLAAKSPRQTPLTVEILEDDAYSIAPPNLSPRALNRSPRPKSPIPPRLFDEASATGRTSPNLQRRSQRARTNSFGKLSSHIASQSDSDSE